MVPQIVATFWVTAVKSQKLLGNILIWVEHLLLFIIYKFNAENGIISLKSS